VANEHDISVVNSLITTTIDSVKGYEHSAEQAEAREYAGFFRNMAGGRRGVGVILQERSRALGGSPNDFGSAAATIHRRVEDLRVALGGGDAALVKEIERGEDYLKEEFDRVLADERMSPGALGVVRECYTSVLKGHDTTKKLRDLLQNA